jgi:hypothetical protein
VTERDPTPPEPQPMHVVREGQQRSPFTAILETFCESLVGAIAAGMVDEEGECVDLAQLPVLQRGRRMAAYDVKLSGAYWQIVIRDAVKLGARELWIQADMGFLVRMLHDGYVLVLLCRPDAMHAVSRRALRQVEVELYREAGWPIPDPALPYWRRVQVRLGPKGQPLALRFAQPAVARDHLQPEPWHQGFEVLSTLSHETASDEAQRARAATRPSGAQITGLEKGFQLLTNTGRELILIREPTGFWYAGATT